MSSWIGQLHDATKWLLPAEHYGLGGIHKTSTKSVNMTSDGLATTAEKWGINSHFPRYWEAKSDRDYHNFGRWGENTIGGIGAVLGGMYGYGALGGGSSAASGAGEGVGAAEAGGGWVPTTYLEQGGGSVTSDAAGGLDWFDPNGMPEGSKFGSDFPNQGGGGNWLSKLTGGSSGGGQGGNASASAQQQRPAYQPPNMGNPALTAALSKLVDEQEQTKRKQQAGPLSGAMGGLAIQPTTFGLTTDDLQRLMAAYGTQYGDSNAGPY